MFCKEHQPVIFYYNVFLHTHPSHLRSFFEYFTASTTVFAPVTTSPDAKIPGMVVSPFASVLSNPRSSTCSSLSRFTIRSCGP